VAFRPKATSAPAVMVIWQDDPFNGSSDASLVATLKSRTIKFGKPVVLVHGDSHKFTWVKATVDPDSPGVFSFISVTS